MNADVYVMDMGRLLDETAENEKTLKTLAADLSPFRREKIGAFLAWKAKVLSLGAGLLLDFGLQAYGLREKEVRIETGPYGKPYLAGCPGIHFNLSHSGSMVMAAFGDRAVGCDIEQMAAAKEKVAERFFAEQEIRALRACGGEAERRVLFYRIWTRKESYMKLTGKGMHLALNGFCVLPDGDGLSCRFREFPVDGYQAALCVPRDGEEFFCSFQKLPDVV